MLSGALCVVATVGVLALLEPFSIWLGLIVWLVAAYLSGSVLGRAGVVASVCVMIVLVLRRWIADGDVHMTGKELFGVVFVGVLLTTLASFGSWVGRLRRGELDDEDRMLPNESTIQRLRRKRAIRRP